MQSTALGHKRGRLRERRNSIIINTTTQTFSGDMNNPVQRNAFLAQPGFIYFRRAYNNGQIFFRIRSFEPTYGMFIIPSFGGGAININTSVAMPPGFVGIIPGSFIADF